MTNDNSLPPGDGPAGSSTPRSATPTPTQSVPYEDRRVTAVTTGTQIIGTYEIEQLISTGGMGEVYRGRNIHNGEPVAIKIVLPSLAHDPKIVALFQKEAMVLGRLSHDAIVRYHVFTNDPAIGRPSLIMEFVAGTALGDQLERGPMPLEDVKVLLRRLASGLDKAHKAGVVHRDLSPDNVILEDGEVEHAKIIDFGIAKSTKIGGGTLLQGQFAGKFNFVSPEQLGAFGGTVDGRSDIYSLALLIAAACRGKLMDMGSSIVDAVGKRASVPDLQGVPPEIAPLLAHMLEPDPANRPESMAAVILMLDNPGMVPPRVGAPGPDPNRTIISASLPPFALPPELGGGQVTGGFAPLSPVPGQTGVPHGGQQAGGQHTGGPFGAPQQTGVPQGGQHTGVPYGGQPTYAPSYPPQEDVDASPFGSSFGGAPATAPATAPERKGGKGGKGGMAVVGIVLVAAIGGTGAWFGGLIPAGMLPASLAPTAQDGPAGASDSLPTPVQTAANGAAAPAPAVPEPVAAPEPAPEAPQSQAEARAIPAAAAAETPQAPAAGSQLAEASPETVGAAEPVSPEPAAPESAAPESAAPESVAPQPAVVKTAEPESLPAPPVAELAPAAAAQRAAATDPVAWMAGHAMPACVTVLPLPGAEGFQAFAVSEAALAPVRSSLGAVFADAPPVSVQTVEQNQCPILDFVNTGRAGTEAPVTLQVQTDGGSLKNGSAITGELAGVGDRSAALFLVNGAGGATNLRPWLSRSSDGAVSFSVAVNLADGAPRGQMILAVVTDAPMTKLDLVPNGVTARALVPFMQGQIADTGQDAALALTHFRIED